MNIPIPEIDPEIRKLPRVARIAEHISEKGCINTFGKHGEFSRSMVRDDDDETPASTSKSRELL
jgi:hypothetical protein